MSRLGTIFSSGGGGCGSGGRSSMFVASGVLFIYAGMVDGQLCSCNLNSPVFEPSTAVIGDVCDQSTTGEVSLREHGRDVCAFG